MLPSSRTLFILSMIGAAAFCQTPRMEIGVQLSGLQENALREYPLGGGGRITVHAFRFVDAEAAVNRCPIGGGDSLFPVTQMTFGARVGQRFGPFGIYGKVKPGFARFDQNLYVPNIGTHAALDIGAVLEFYSRHHFAGRLDSETRQSSMEAASRFRRSVRRGLLLCRVRAINCNVEPRSFFLVLNGGRPSEAGAEPRCPIRAG